MITLNLIPPAQKQELKIRQIYLTIKNIIIIILLFIIITAIILLLTKMVLQNHFNKVVTYSTLTTKNVRLFTVEIKEFNQQLSSVIKIQKEYTPWSKVIIHFSKLTPENLGIYSLSFNKEEERATIRGIAKTRQNLLDFKDSLESSPIFQDINIPLKDLLMKENINFGIELKINLSQVEKL